MLREFGCSVLVLCVASGGAQAQSVDELEERERAIVRRMSATSQMEQRHGRLVRGRQALGEGGVSTSVGGWQEDAHDWILGWMRILGLADLREQLSYDVFERSLSQYLRQQADGLESLRRRARPLATDANRAMQLFTSLTPVSDAPELAPYRAVIDRMLEVEATSREAADRTKAYVADRLSELERIDAVSRRLLFARLEAALIEREMYPLRETLERVRTLLDAEAAVDPVLARLGAWERELNQHSIRLHLFHARRAIEGARQSCTEARAELGRLNSPTTFVNTAREHAERLCRASENHFRIVNGLGVAPWEIVAEMLRVERVELDALCRRAATPALGCERLAVMAALPDAALGAMSEAELDFLETEWVRELSSAKGSQP